jgi:hypothetical protein
MKQPEVYELIKQIEYFYDITANINANIARLNAHENPNPTASSIKRFLIFKEQVDTHIADIIDELQTAKNGALS